jgi:hypothetical protein
LRAGDARRLSALALATFGALAAGAPGCGNDDDAGDEGPASAAQFLAGYETSLCALVSSCCASRALPSSGAACPRAVRATFPASLFDETKYAYDRGNASACLRALRAMPSACEPFADGSFGPGSDFEQACGRAFLPRGVATPGQPCAGAWQCAAPAERDALSSCALVTLPDGSYGQACEVLGYSGEGGPCDTGIAPRPDARLGVTRACKPGGLYCASDGTCKAVTTEGQPCEAGGCVQGAFCNGQSVCEARRGVGSPCGDAAGACDGAGFCERTSKVCLARRAEGEPCASEAECQGACAGGACSAPLPDRSNDYTALCASAS